MERSNVGCCYSIRYREVVGEKMTIKQLEIILATEQDEAKVQKAITAYLKGEEK